jgi:hypothetical protein
MQHEQHEQRLLPASLAGELVQEADFKEYRAAHGHPARGPTYALARRASRRGRVGRAVPTSSSASTLADSCGTTLAGSAQSANPSATRGDGRKLIPAPRDIENSNLSPSWSFRTCPRLSASSRLRRTRGAGLSGEDGRGGLEKSSRWIARPASWRSQGTASILREHGDGEALSTPRTVVPSVTVIL